jgi:hypothetical protein
VIPEEHRAFVEQNKAIPTSEVQQDIIDTQREIDESLARLRVLRMQVGYHEQGIEKRYALIKRLRMLLRIRGEEEPTC